MRQVWRLQSNADAVVEMSEWAFIVELLSDGDELSDEIGLGAELLRLLRAAEEAKMVKAMRIVWYLQHFAAASLDELTFEPHNTPEHGGGSAMQASAAVLCRADAALARMGASPWPSVRWDAHGASQFAADACACEPRPHPALVDGAQAALEQYFVADDEAAHVAQAEWGRGRSLSSIITLTASRGAFVRRHALRLLSPPSGRYPRARANRWRRAARTGSTVALAGARGHARVPARRAGAARAVGARGGADSVRRGLAVPPCDGLAAARAVGIAGGHGLHGAAADCAARVGGPRIDAAGGSAA